MLIWSVSILVTWYIVIYHEKAVQLFIEQFLYWPYLNIMRSINDVYNNLIYLLKLIGSKLGF